jgi:hypothetical protein
MSHETHLFKATREDVSVVAATIAAPLAFGRNLSPAATVPPSTTFTTPAVTIVPDPGVTDPSTHEASGKLTLSLTTARFTTSSSVASKDTRYPSFPERFVSQVTVFVNRICSIQAIS